MFGVLGEGALVDLVVPVGVCSFLWSPEEGPLLLAMNRRADVC